MVQATQWPEAEINCYLHFPDHFLPLEFSLEKTVSKISKRRNNKEKIGFRRKWKKGQENGRKDSSVAMIDNLLDIFPLSRFGAYASKRFHSFQLFFVNLSSNYYLKAMKMKRKKRVTSFFF